MALGPAATHDPTLPVPHLRLDHELARDLRRAVGSPAILGFLALQAVAAAVFIARRGPGTAQTIALVWAGLAFVAFICWWAGRHRLAHPEPDPVPMARVRLLAALTVALGLAVGTYGISRPAAGAITLGGIVAWLVVAMRAGSGPDLAGMLRRSWRPFGPLLILVVVPRVALTGLVAPAGLVAGLGSGVVQELLYLPLLFASLEAVVGRRDVAAVVAALVFASIHVPMNLGAADGDWIAALANAIFYQALVGLIVAMAYTRHRAALPLGIAHGLTIA